MSTGSSKSVDMRIGGPLRLWLALAGLLLALAAPADAAVKRGELVLRGDAGAQTFVLPEVRLLVPDGAVPAAHGHIRGYVIREAISGELVLAALSYDLPGFSRVRVFSRGQGYESGHLAAGRYRIALLGDAKGAKDITIPVEGLISGRRVVPLNGGLYLRGIGIAEPTGAGSSYRSGPIRIAYPMGLIWGWGAERGIGVHRTEFCFVPSGTDCSPDTSLAVHPAPTRLGGSHFSAPSTRPPGEYDLVLNSTSVGPAGPVAIVAWVFL